MFVLSILHLTFTSTVGYTIFELWRFLKGVAHWTCLADDIKCPNMETTIEQDNLPQNEHYWKTLLDVAPIYTVDKLTLIAESQNHSADMSQ